MIRPSIVSAVVRRELLEIVRNRTLLAAIVVPPVLLVALPVILTSFGGKTDLPPDVVRNVIASRPDWAGLSPQQVVDAFGLQQMVVFFLLMPATIPLAIASYSIVGEKQTRSLEAVVAAPISTEELLAGKTIASLTPAIGTVWLAYGALIVVSRIVLGPELARIVVDPTWLVTVFALGPAIGLLSVIAGVAISSRVSDPRSAQQIGTVIVLPLIGFLVIQLSSGRLIGTREYLLAAGAAAVVGVIGLRVASRLFGRETILTRWTS
jgi:ABC-2 type transport system permease protein